MASGRKRAAAAVDAAAGSLTPDAMVSTGFCGALDEKLAVGEIVVAYGDPRIAIVPGRPLPVAATAPFRSGAGLLHRPGGRAPPRKSGNFAAPARCAVEMEAAGVAERAESLGIPFYCVRAVTDLAGETLANDFNAALRPDGHFATMRYFTGSFASTNCPAPGAAAAAKPLRPGGSGFGRFYCRLPILV